MWRYTVFIISLTGVISTFGQKPAPKICWDTKWYNNSAPTATNRSDYETKPANVLNSICSSGKVIAARCRDQIGEPFTGFFNDSTNQYIARCTTVTGLICNPYNNSKATCPDFDIQYGCACQIIKTPRGRSTTDASPSPERNHVQRLLFSVVCFVLEAVVYLLF